MGEREGQRTASEFLGSGSLETRGLRSRFHRGFIAQAAVRTPFVVLLSPRCDPSPRIEDVLEPTYCLM